MANDLAPHSAALWIRWEVHERLSGGMLSGSPKDFNEYGGVIHAQDRTLANIKIKELVEKIKQEIKNASTSIATEE